MDISRQSSDLSHSATTLDVCQRLMISDLEFEDQLRMMWGWCRRGVCISILAGIAGAIAGGILGFIVGIAIAIAGKDVNSVKIYLQIVGGLVGFIVGFVFIFPLIRWITNVNFGSSQMWIVKVK